MTAEFVSTGFAAVSAFFGSSISCEQEEQRHTIAPSYQRTGRQGVGSKPEQFSNATATASTKFSKKLFNVRTRKPIDEDDDNTSEDSEEEEEHGRTDIATPKGVSAGRNEVPADPISVKTKPKKLGKKERKNATSIMTTNEPLPETNNTIISSAEDTKKKRPRKKVRSRQKNIRKDHRTIKPEHLRVGGADFSGRPLTSETRNKLQLPPSNSALHRQQHWKNDNYAAPNKGSGLSMVLGVDDLMKDNDDDGQAKLTPTKNRTHDSIGKKRKRYKNLL